MRTITHNFWFRLLAMLLVTTLCALLILQALTAETVLVCGKEEHAHSEDCYEKVLVCGLEEGEPHVHTEACYEELPVLLCTLPEGEGHAHSEDCWQWQRPLICGEEERPAAPGHTHGEGCYETRAALTCGEEERPAVPGHTHSAECYEVQRLATCALEESAEAGGHIHTEDCYTTYYILACPLEEVPDEPGHTHSDACYGELRTLVCTEEERPDDPGHTHSEACYGEAEQALGCGEEEYEAHSHTEACYTLERQLVCGLEEGQPHEHSEDCRELSEEPSCGKREHKHTADCYSDPSADVENADIWDAMFKDLPYTGVWADDLIAVAKSQLGYRESARNFVFDEHDAHAGYTRYGHWYNNAWYAPWCADFVSFCLHYAGIPQAYIPRDEGCGNWIRQLTELDLYRKAGEHLPVKGDLIFFDTDPDGRADHVGLVEYTDDEGIHTIEGNVNDFVVQLDYRWGDTSIMGYGSLARAYDRWLLATADEALENIPETEAEAPAATDTDVPAATDTDVPAATDTDVPAAESDMPAATDTDAPVATDTDAPVWVFEPMDAADAPAFYERRTLTVREDVSLESEDEAPIETREVERELFVFADIDGQEHYRIYGRVNGIGPGFFAADETGALLTPEREDWESYEKALDLSAPIDPEADRADYCIGYTVLSAEFDGMCVKLLAPPEAFPEGELELIVSEPPLEEQIEVDKQLAEIEKYVVLNIAILCDGEEVQPTEPVKLIFEGAQGLFSTEEPIVAYHFSEAEDGGLTAERIETDVNETGDVSFGASGFSNYALTGAGPLRAPGNMTGYAAALRDRSNYIGVASEFSDSPYTVDRVVWGGTQVNIRDDEEDIGGTLYLNNQSNLGWATYSHSYDAEQYYDNDWPFRFTANPGVEGYTLEFTTYNDRALEDGKAPYAAMKFDNLNLDIITGISQMNFFARGNKLVMGEGLTTQSGKTWRIFGGTEHNADLFPNGRPDMITDVVVASGHWNQVFGGGQGATGRGTDADGSTTSGTQVTIRGTAVVDEVYGGGERKGSINADDAPGPGSAETNGRGINVYIEGGTVGTLYGGSAINRSAYGIPVDADTHVVINEDININVTGGTVGRIVAGDDTRDGGNGNHVSYTVLSQSPVNGDATVNLYAANSVGSVYGDMERNTPRAATEVRQVQGRTRLNIYANQSFNTVDLFDLVNIEGATVTTGSMMGWTMNDTTLSVNGSDGYIGQIRVADGGKLILTQRAVINRPYTHYAPTGQGNTTSSQYVVEADKAIKASANHNAYYLAHGWIGETSEERRSLSTIAINGQTTGIPAASGTAFNDSTDVCGLLIHGGVYGSLGGTHSWNTDVPGYSTLEVLGNPIYSDDTHYYYYIVSDGSSSNILGTSSTGGPSANGGAAFKEPEGADYIVCYRYLDGGTKIGWYLRERPSVTLQNSLVHVGDTTPVTATIDLGGLAYEWDSDSALNRVAINITRTAGSESTAETIRTLTIDKNDLADLSALVSAGRVSDLTYLSDTSYPKSFTLVVDDFSDGTAAADEACYYTVSVDYIFDDTRVGAAADAARCVYDFVKNGVAPSDPYYQDSIMETTPYVDGAHHEGADKAKLILSLPYGCTAASFMVIEDHEDENHFWMTDEEDGQMYEVHLANSKSLEENYASRPAEYANENFAVVLDEENIYNNLNGTHFTRTNVSGSNSYVCAVYSFRNVNVKRVSNAMSDYISTVPANRVASATDPTVYIGELIAADFPAHEGLDLDLQLSGLTRNGQPVGAGDPPMAEDLGELRIRTVPLVYTVAYHLNGGTGPTPDDPHSYRYEDQATVLNIDDSVVPPDTNLRFAGWNTRPDGSGNTFTPDSLMTVTDNVTLYARWSDNNFLVEKNWEGDTDYYQLRPAYVKVQLEKLVEGTYAPVTPPAGKSNPVTLTTNSDIPWTYDFRTEFGITDADNSAYRVVELDDGYTASGNGCGYYLKKSWKPYGFEVDNDLRLTEITLLKVDSEGHSLHDARFRLTRSGAGGSITAVSDYGGLVHFRNIPIGSYTLVEEHAPAGYKLPTYAWTVVVTDPNTSYTGEEPLNVAITDGTGALLSPVSGQYIITNEANLPLPHVGGLGTPLVYSFSTGIVLLSFGMIFLLKSGRRKAGKGGDRPTS